MAAAAVVAAVAAPPAVVFIVVAGVPLTAKGPWKEPRDRRSCATSTRCRIAASSSCSFRAWSDTAGELSDDAAEKEEEHVPEWRLRLSETLQMNSAFAAGWT